MFILLLYLQFVIYSYANINDADAEDLSQFSRDNLQGCPDLILWPQVPVPLACDDPECQGISRATPPYRCRKCDGFMFNFGVFGCRCCPRFVDCGDPICAGSFHNEVCQSETLVGCLCISPNRRALTLFAAVPLDTTTAVALILEEALVDPTIYESFDDNDIEAMITSSGNCPHRLPIRCLDPQCRGSNDWKTRTSSPPRCNRADGNQTCTSASLHGCFCDWPNSGPHYGVMGSPDVLTNDADTFLDDSNYRPLGDERDIITTHPLAATPSSFYGGRPLATQTGIALTIPQILACVNMSSSREDGIALSHNCSVFEMLDYLKRA